MRFITNRSSGKQGHAIAIAAARRGAAVTLVTSSPLVLPPDVSSAVTRIDVETAADMEHAVGAAAEGADVVVMAAAVADFRPKRSAEDEALQGRGPPRTGARADARHPGRAWRPDAVRDRSWSGSRRRPTTPLERGRRKLARKGVDLLVVNDVSAPGRDSTTTPTRSSFWKRTGACRKSR